MIKIDWGLWTRIVSRLPISRVEARKRVHLELIGAARQQVTQSVMLGMLHAIKQKDAPIEYPAKIWWKAQTTKWEVIWRMLNEATVDLYDFQKISDLKHVGESAFKLYEQLSVVAVTTFCEVPANNLHVEARRWRDVAALILSLHRHCIMNKLDESQRGKTATVSGITDMKGN